jgi:hypothetical protein
MVDRHKLGDLEEALASAGVTLDFLLSQSLTSIAEIAAELSTSAIQQKKLVHAVDVTQREIRSETYQAGSRTNSSASAVQGIQESFFDDDASNLSSISLEL